MGLQGPREQQLVDLTLRPKNCKNRNLTQPSSKAPAMADNLALLGLLLLASTSFLATAAPVSGKPPLSHTHGTSSLAMQLPSTHLPNDLHLQSIASLRSGDFTTHQPAGASSHIPGPSPLSSFSSIRSMSPEPLHGAPGRFPPMQSPQHVPRALDQSRVSGNPLFDGHHNQLFEHGAAKPPALPPIRVRQGPKPMAPGAGHQPVPAHGVQPLSQMAMASHPGVLQTMGSVPPVHATAAAPHSPAQAHAGLSSPAAPAHSSPAKSAHSPGQLQMADPHVGSNRLQTQLAARPSLLTTQPVPAPAQVPSRTRSGSGSGSGSGSASLRDVAGKQGIGKAPTLLPPEVAGKGPGSAGKQKGKGWKCLGGSCFGG